MHPTEPWDLCTTKSWSACDLPLPACDFYCAFYLVRRMLQSDVYRDSAFPLVTFYKKNQYIYGIFSINRNFLLKLDRLLFLEHFLVKLEQIVCMCGTFFPYKTFVLNLKHIRYMHIWRWNCFIDWAINFTKLQIFQ